MDSKTAMKVEQDKNKENQMKAYQIQIAENQL